MHVYPFSFSFSFLFPFYSPPPIVLLFPIRTERQRKVAAKKKAQEMKGKEEEMVNMLKQALELAKDMKYPTQPEEREKFFMENIQAGELLFRQGPHKVVESAVAFFHAIKIYPNPTDILVLLQKSVPEDVFALVYAMISTEVQINQMMDKQQQH